MGFPPLWRAIPQIAASPPRSDRQYRVRQCYKLLDLAPHPRGSRLVFQFLLVPFLVSFSKCRGSRCGFCHAPWGKRIKAFGRRSEDQDTICCSGWSPKVPILDTRLTADVQPFLVWYVYMIMTLRPAKGPRGRPPALDQIPCRAETPARHQFLTRSPM